MENFLNDNEDILFHLEHLDLDRIIRFKEEEFTQAEQFSYAPKDAADARDSYKRVLSIIGEMCGEFIAPNAPKVDEEGPLLDLATNQVTLNPATQKAMDMFAQADLMGFCIPRRYGGLNMPSTILCIASELLSRADASALNFGLQQDIAETINKFASEEQKQAVLPRLCSGEWGSSMILTEPDAGSDLQAVNLKAVQGEDGKWYLSGVKRFITNGCGTIGLVLARSEEKGKGARGLSFFLYERDDKMIIRRLEHKLGIHGSPTCELQFNKAPAELVGERQRGLTKYTMWLMNNARLGIAAQAVGIAEAAYREADLYAAKRIQFNVSVRTLPPVFEMLTEMKVAVEAGRTLLYETARFVDLKEVLEDFSDAHPDQKGDIVEDKKRYAKLAGFFTPLVKAYATEMANKVAYDAIQIHGGTGYMKEFNAERHYRDARITNIYEGTTQLQVVAAIGPVTSGIAQSILDEYDQADFTYAADLIAKVRAARKIFDATLDYVKAYKGEGHEQFLSYHSRRLVEMTTDLVISYLLLRDAVHSERKLKVAAIFIAKAPSRIEASHSFITGDNGTLLRCYAEVIGAGE
ncbi:acyl-CoA dehydrogenase family protein [Treponema primitia]|uniref:acyl-CoA dehydrogenase family protein n=1 Tax=Treponema primitia TaxID=88058 RepID=UPI000255542C|nr:acyl-CoA dehydrogenase family protein [Treponema primitia]